MGPEEEITGAFRFRNVVRTKPNISTNLWGRIERRFTASYDKVFNATEAQLLH